MERKDEGVATIFIENAYMDGVRLEAETNTYYSNNERNFYEPVRRRYTLSFETPNQIIFDNPITMHRGDSYEVLIMIREKQ